VTATVSDGMEPVADADQGDAEPGNVEAHGLPVGKIVPAAQANGVRPARTVGHGLGLVGPFRPHGLGLVGPLRAVRHRAPRSVRPRPEQ
jgi:hypothetical protein